jgi:hypothetical protein
VRTHTAIAEYVDIRAKRVFEILLQANEIEQITARLHLDEQVNIAGRPCLSPGHRAEYADIERTVIRCPSQDLIPLHPQPVKVYEKLAAVGLRPPTPSRSEWPAYQLVGEQIAADGWTGILVPSAARPEGKVLCLFRDQDGIRGATPVPPPSHVPEPPPPPAGLRT